LGLQTVEEQRSPAVRKAKFAELARQYLDLTPLLKLAWSSSAESPAPVEISPIYEPHVHNPQVRIGLARDKAFSFYYEDNLDLLREHGADIIPFSPLTDEHLPANLDCLYLGGGYPELYAEPLSRNRQLCAELRSFVESCRPVYAECGGMVYLGRSLTALDGTVFPMSAVLPLEFEMTPRLVQFGYVDVEFVEDCLLGEKGTAIRGHSFHCSRVRGGAAMPTAYRLKYSLSGHDELEGFHSKNVLASYVHLHFRGNSALVPSLVMAARRTQARSVEVSA
jgi:cobyrinic acid a,c-diamide synthase